MFDWLKGTKGESKPASEPRITPGEAIADMGALVERHSGSIMDTSMLPLPKVKMKILIKAMYAQQNDPNLRNILETGFILLAHFQDGVGPTPIAPPVPPRVPTSDNMKPFEHWRKWNSLFTDDMGLLSAEWRRFLGGEPI